MEKRGKIRYIFSFVTLTVLLGALIFWNINAGSVSVSLGEVFSILFQKGGDETARNIIWSIRLPRILAALILGGSSVRIRFSCSRLSSTTLLRGRLSWESRRGAKLTVALTMIFLLGKRPDRGFCGDDYGGFRGFADFHGICASGLQKGPDMSMLVICGVMIGYICSAVTDFVVTFADDSNIINLHNWSQGSFSGMNWDNVALMAVVVFVALGLAFFLSKPMSAYQLGEAYARNMGVNISRFRVELILLSSVLSACVTAFAGPISFVGIAVPQLMKSLLKTAKPILVIPACFLGGAVFCLFCDLIARTVFAPTELSISSVTAVFGAPVVIYVMINRKRG